MCRRKLCRHVFMLPTQNSSLACTTKMKPRGNKIVFLCMTSSGSNWNKRWRKSIGLHGKNQEWFLGERNPVSTVKTYFLLIDQVLCFMLDGKWFMHHSVCHSETPKSVYQQQGIILRIFWGLLHASWGSCGYVINNALPKNWSQDSVRCSSKWFNGLYHGNRASQMSPAPTILFLILEALLGRLVTSCRR